MEIQIAMESIVDIKQEEDNIKIESMSSSDSEADSDVQENKKQEKTESTKDLTQNDDRKSFVQHTTKIRGPPKVKCEICLKTFASPYFLNRHRNIHLGASKYKCKHCPKTFLIKSSMRIHLKRKHPEKNSQVKTFTCDICGKIYFTLRDLERHVINLHVVDKSVECQECSKMFVDENHLAQHVKYNHKRKPKVCDVCSDTFTQRKYFVRHLEIKHGRFFYCDQCFRSFGTKQDFDQHSAVLSDSPELQCHICLVFLPNQCSSNIHIKSHAKELGSDTPVKEEKSSSQDLECSGKRFKCDLCVKTFARSLSLSLHRKKVHTISKWQCKFCPKICETRNLLVSHEKVHSEIKPLECSVCQKRFKRQGELKAHEKSHDGVKRFKCLICHQAFNVSTKLRVHMSNHHGVEKPFKCHLCDQSWVFKSRLERHLISHEKDRIFQCDECDKSFKTNGKLRLHFGAFHSDIEKPRRSSLKPKNDSLIFVCSLCKFETKDGKEVALHNDQHGFPKVLLSKAVLCAQHKSSENISLATSNADNNVRAFVKMEQGSDAQSCYLCSPVDSLPTNFVVSHAIMPRFKCKHCRKLFVELPFLRDHLKIHFDDNANKCSRCSKQLNSIQSLKYHLKNCRW